MDRMITLILKMPDKEKQRLEECSDRTGLAQSKIVRDALEEYLRRREDVRK